MFRLGPHRLTVRYHDYDRAPKEFPFWLVVTLGGRGPNLSYVVLDVRGQYRKIDQDAWKRPSGASDLSSLCWLRA